MKLTYTLYNPLTMPRAELLRGKRVRALVRDEGLQATYEGVLTPVSAGKTKVGDEILMNECVRTITVLEVR